ncbi:hypothetical protein A3C94_00290 [Candidatus Kaiserbacteria bacterium RIFCSPHIGHO2_02_FULL_55_17]|uniref:Uncharacterized protein n=1 Tax=Candidatus Kaiserbacteria bacterium RIFCSPHIGHO2_02_FULL_55_17 TaxID=1798496 RepID=A0A1F6DRY9_9BACT|nr:MAG: hypothetical protein UY94_C0020G0003 [Parcubacteria group bacterium GW2011_GWA2_56_21]OGG64156.1 MAG: hypothetical protein A3C94_00290 [Candidatus Kaiserbacteria bacterium RIFCSPHIGHO2_02_FULL_55_17]
MIATTVEIPELFDTLAKASWHDVGSSDDDHKLERTDLPSQLEVLYIRKKDKPNQIYMAKVKNGNDWKCVKCATTVLAARVAHTIRDGIFPLSGSGEVSYETVPYCPTCEKKPDFHGSTVIAD